MELPAHQRALIAGRMRQLHMSQQELAKLLGIDQTTLSAKLAGKRPFAREEVVTIVGLLEVEEMQQEYPEAISDDVRNRRRVQMALRIMERSFQAMPAHDLQEVLFALALVLEGKRAVGAGETSMLRGLSHLQPRPMRADMATALV